MIPNITVVTVVFSLVDHCILFFEVPVKILTDVDTQYKSIIFTEITRLLGIHRL